MAVENLLLLLLSFISAVYALPLLPAGDLCPPFDCPGPAPPCPPHARYVPRVRLPFLAGACCPGCPRCRGEPPAPEEDGCDQEEVEPSGAAILLPTDSVAAIPEELAPAAADSPRGGASGLPVFVPTLAPEQPERPPKTTAKVYTTSPSKYKSTTYSKSTVFHQLTTQTKPTATKKPSPAVPAQDKWASLRNSFSALLSRLDLPLAPPVPLEPAATKPATVGGGGGSSLAGAAGAAKLIGLALDDFSSSHDADEDVDEDLRRSSLGGGPPEGLSSDVVRPPPPVPVVVTPDAATTMDGSSSQDSSIPSTGPGELESVQCPVAALLGTCPDAPCSLWDQITPLVAYKGRMCPGCPVCMGQ